MTALALTISPAPATTSTATIELTGTLAGGKGKDSVQWQTDHGYTGTATVSASGAWTTTNIPLVTGPNTLTVLAFDAADNVSTKTATVTLQQATASTVSPITLSIASPVSPVVMVNAPTISVSGKASGGAGVTEITWQTSNGATGTACGTGTWVATGIPVPEGNTTIILRAYDSKGASAWVALVVRCDRRERIQRTMPAAPNRMNRCGWYQQLSSLESAIFANMAHFHKAENSSQHTDEYFVDKKSCKRSLTRAGNVDIRLFSWSRRRTGRTFLPQGFPVARSGYPSMRRHAASRLRHGESG